jgi:hypothetical protein
MAPGSMEMTDEPMSKLTDDILVDIISRLPYKSTCCCKCVSTRWGDLISQSHPDHRKKMPQSLAGFFYESYISDRDPRIARHFANVSEKTDPLVDTSLSFLPKYESIEVLDSWTAVMASSSSVAAGRRLIPRHWITWCVILPPRNGWRCKWSSPLGVRASRLLSLPCV